MPVIIKTRSDGVKQRFNISPLRPIIKLLYLQGKPSREVGKILNISHARVLQLLKKENINRRSITKPIPNKDYKKLTPERAYIFGVMCGDGCVFSGIVRKKQWEYLNYAVNLAVKDRDFINEFVRCIKLVYGISPSICLRQRSQKNPRWSDIWVVHITRKEIYQDLVYYQFGTHKWNVPYEIKNSNDEIIIGAFLRGFYDSEGSVLKGKRSFGIHISSSNLNGLQEVKELLRKLNIESSKISIDKRHKNNVFHFPISKKASIIIFLNKIGFSIKRKENKIKEYFKCKNAKFQPISQFSSMETDDGASNIQEIHQMDIEKVLKT